MKKYLLGTLGLIIAIASVAFTTIPTPKTDYVRLRAYF